MKNITVYTLVYNEESRIETLLKNCLWSDDIIIYDKSSTDKTREIASRYPCRIIQLPYYDTGSGLAKNIVNDAKNEWCLSVSASDLIHPELVDKWLELINRADFNYDVIAFPYVVGVLGIIDDNSPWSTQKLKKYLYKKSVVIFTEQVHKEMSFTSSKIYYMKKSTDIAVFHLTHKTLDIFFERHIRYTRAEAQKYKSRLSAYWICMLRIFLAIVWMIFWKRLLFKGWRGVFLFMAFLSYFLMEFLFAWQRFDGKGKTVYDKIRKDILKEWEDAPPK